MFEIGNKSNFQTVLSLSFDAHQNKLILIFSLCFMTETVAF